MPRSTISNRRAYTFDKQLELRDLAAAALNATTSGAAVLHPVTLLQDFRAVITALAHTGYVATTAQWTLAIEASSNGTNWFQVGNAITLTGVAGIFEVALSGEGIHDVVPNADRIRVTATRTGTPGNLQYGAYLSP